MLFREILALFDLPSHLLDLEDDKLRRLERREANDDIDDAAIDVVLRGRLLVALHEVSFARSLALKRTLPNRPMHECADV